MKKHLFLLAVGAIALTACTSEDVLEEASDSRNQIKFDAAVYKPTRAVDLDMSNFDQFKVYGFYTMPQNPNKAHQVFNNVTVKKAATGHWSYLYEGSTTPAHYWVYGASYYFYAYSCGSTEELSTDYGTFNLDMDDPIDGQGKDVNSRVLEIDNYVCDNKHQHDLIIAAYTGYKPQEGVSFSVPLAFKHVLTKIKANFTSKFPSEYEVIIKNVSVNNIRNEGDFKFSTSTQTTEAGSWDNVTRTGGTPLIYLLEPRLVDEVNEAGETVAVDKNTLTVSNQMSGDNQVSVETNTAYVIPWNYQAKEVNLYFVIDVMYGKDYVFQDVPLTATFQPEWKEGYYYQYNVEISPDAINMKQIDFLVTVVKGWDQPTPNSENVPIDSKK